MKELIEIQNELKAPKNLTNKFGGYKYRNLEGILEGVKPLLKKHDCTVTISDSVEEVGGRVYVKATVSITNKSGETLSVSAYAREAEDKKGMDASQITGTASSYARKYAANGLFLIDDTKDADTDEYREERNSRAAADETADKPINKSSVGVVKNLLKETGTDESMFCNWLEIESVEEMPNSVYRRAYDALIKKQNKQKGDN